MVAVRSSERVELRVCQALTHDVRHGTPGVVVGELAPVGEHDLLDVHPRRVGEAVDVHGDPGEDPGLPGRGDVVLLPELLDLVRHVVCDASVVVPGARVPAAGFPPAWTPRGRREGLRTSSGRHVSACATERAGSDGATSPMVSGAGGDSDRDSGRRWAPARSSSTVGPNRRGSGPGGVSSPRDDRRVLMRRRVRRVSRRAAIATRPSRLLVGSRRASKTGAGEPKTCRAGWGAKKLAQHHKFRGVRKVARCPLSRR